VVSSDKPTLSSMIKLVVISLKSREFLLLSSE
jgi:hypothetical protein